MPSFFSPIGANDVNLEFLFSMVRICLLIRSFDVEKKFLDSMSVRVIRRRIW